MLPRAAPFSRSRFRKSACHRQDPRPRRQTDVQADRFSPSHAHGRGVGLKSILAHLDPVRAFRQLDDELILTLWRRPQLAVDEDVGVGGPDTEQQGSELGLLARARRGP